MRGHRSCGPDQVFVTETKREKKSPLFCQVLVAFLITSPVVRPATRLCRNSGLIGARRHACRRSRPKHTPCLSMQTRRVAKRKARDESLSHWNKTQTLYDSCPTRAPVADALSPCHHRPRRTSTTFPPRRRPPKSPPMACGPSTSPSPSPRPSCRSTCPSTTATNQSRARRRRFASG